MRVSCLRRCGPLTRRAWQTSNICLVHPVAPGEVPFVKLIDFGTTKLAAIDSRPNSITGTPYYRPPEVRTVSACAELRVCVTALRHAVPQMYLADSARSNKRDDVPVYEGKPVDIWSIGITLHILLRGDYPYDDFKQGLTKTKDETLTSYLMTKLDRSVQVSPECRDFVEQCLAFDAAARPTVEQLMAHAWMQGAVTPAAVRTWLRRGSVLLLSAHAWIAPCAHRFLGASRRPAWLRATPRCWLSSMMLCTA